MSSLVLCLTVVTVMDSSSLSELNGEPGIEMLELLRGVSVFDIFEQDARKLTRFGDSHF